ncbi:hypothetical protein WMY93_008065 [Mugilogobius chulae]|uniref:Transmembrane protein n=1 Tax=Mugilogobius chulae TaxID=88201 RepID=A0AAW0PNR3_9GOBI
MPGSAKDEHSLSGGFLQGGPGGSCAPVAEVEEARKKGLKACLRFAGTVVVGACCVCVSPPLFVAEHVSGRGTRHTPVLHLLISFSISAWSAHHYSARLFRHARSSLSRPALLSSPASTACCQQYIV